MPKPSAMMETYLLEEFGPVHADDFEEDMRVDLYFDGPPDKWGQPLEERIVAVRIRPSKKDYECYVFMEVIKPKLRLTFSERTNHLIYALKAASPVANRIQDIIYDCHGRATGRQRAARLRTRTTIRDDD